MRDRVGPLVEEVPDAPDERLVTYVWRASGPDVRAVELVGSPVAFSSPLTRVEGSDTWAATFRVRADLRHRYAFHESRDGTGFSWADHWRSLQPDPSNPARFPDDTLDASVPALPESDWLPASVLALASAESEALVRRRPGVATGTVVASTFTSAILGNTRRVWTYVPDGEPRGLLVMNDGWEWRALTPLAPILDNLIAAGRIPPLLAVMHECPSGAREAELACGEDFAAAVGDELLPWIRSRFSVAPAADRTVVAGQSYGALSAAFLARRRPDLFGNVLSQSGAYWYGGESLVGEYARSARVPVRFWLDVGLLEGHMVGVNRRFRDVLTARGYRVTYREVNSDHSWLNWRSTVGPGLEALTATWT